MKKSKIMANRITKLNSDVQEKVIEKNQEDFVLKDEEQKTFYSLNEILNRVILEPTFSLLDQKNITKGLIKKLILNYI